MKLRGKRGFTLVEILVATLILVMVSLCVMLGVNSSQKIYQESLFVSESELLSDTLNTAVGDILHYAEYKKESGGSVYFVNNDYKRDLELRFCVKDGYLYMTPDSTVTDSSDLYQILGKSGYSSLRIKDFTMSHSDGVFSGKYTITHSQNDQLNKEVEFSFRTIR